jgi:hypothetical protein
MSAMDVLRDHIGGGLGVVAEGHFHDIEARRRPPGTRDPDCGRRELRPQRARSADVSADRMKAAHAATHLPVKPLDLVYEMPLPSVLDDNDTDQLLGAAAQYRSAVYHTRGEASHFGAVL